MHSYCAYRDELIEQAVDKIRRVAPDADIGVVKAERDATEAGVVVASIQTLARPNRLARLIGPFSTVVIDEAHHAAAATYRTVIDATMGPDTLLLGVTATPDRGDGVGLDDIFTEIVFKRTLPQMVAAGYLSDLRAIQVRTGADYAFLHVSHGDFRDSEAGHAVMEGHAPELSRPRAYCEHAKGRRSLVFTPTVEVAHAIG